MRAWLKNQSYLVVALSCDVRASQEHLSAQVEMSDLKLGREEMPVFPLCPPGRSVRNLGIKADIISFQAYSPKAVVLVGQHWHSQGS